MTIERLAAIVGAATDLKWESDEAWWELLKGKSRMDRVSMGRRIVYMVLQDVVGVSYVEIGRLFDRDPGGVHRGLKAARAWAKANAKNRATWDVIRKKIASMIDEERSNTLQSTGS